MEYDIHEVDLQGMHLATTTCVNRKPNFIEIYYGVVHLLGVWPINIEKRTFDSEINWRDTLIGRGSRHITDKRAQLSNLVMFIGLDRRHRYRKANGGAVRN